MKKFLLPLLIACSCMIRQADAQQYDSLNSLKKVGVQIYYSTGHEQRANNTGTQVEKALAYFQRLLDFKPVVTLLVLNKADWKKYTTMPAVYGMPHFDAKIKTLFVAAEDNPFWKSFLPPLDQLPPDLRKQVQAVYTNPAGDISMQAFFDLLAIHELGHTFHTQNGITMQRKWMGELFVNMLLHNYIARYEPALLPALTLFPKMVVAGGSKEFKFTSLQDIDDRYDEIARDHPKNYGWYQCRWHSAAADIYDAAGEQAVIKLWTALKGQKLKLSDKDLVLFLEINVDKSLADLVKKWDDK